MTRPRLLLVEDEPGLQLSLTDRLSAEGYHVEGASDGHTAVARATGEAFDVIVLDVMLPGRDGFEVLRAVRQQGVTTPVLMLTARGQVVDKVVGLKMGADDYLTKPFHMGELLARIAAVRRRAAASAQSTPGIVSVGDLVIDLTRREVRRGEEEIRLTRKEFDLLQEFVIHADRVLTYSHLLNAVWGPGYDDPHLVQVHVGNLRRKLQQGSSGRRLILPLSGIGYRLRTGA